MRNLLIALLVLELYLCLGGLIFYYVEFCDFKMKQKTTATTWLNVSLLLEEFKQYASLSDDVISPQLEAFVSYMNDSVNNNSSARVLSTMESVMASYVFSATIVSTIGYGSMVPETALGKAIVMIYATLGIPLCLVGFAQLGKVLSRHMSVLASKLFRLFSVKPTETAAKLVEFLLAIVCGILVHLVVPSLVFFYVENWSYLDTLYWLFVTLSTIGFGDIVPGIFEGQLEEHYTTQILYLVFLTVVIIGGVSWMAAIVTITKDIVEDVLPEEKPTDRTIQVSHVAYPGNDNST